MGPSPPYLVRLQLKEGAAAGAEYPFSLPLIRCLDIEFTSPVTFFVGARSLRPFISTPTT